MNVLFYILDCKIFFSNLEIFFDIMKGGVFFFLIDVLMYINIYLFDLKIDVIFFL